MLDAARLKSFHTSLTMYVHGVLFLWCGLAPWGARWAMVVQQLFASQITCACITMNVCHIVQYSNQGYIPVYSVPCDPLHRQGTFWWLCLQLLDNGSLVSAVDTVKANVVSFHKKWLVHTTCGYPCSGPASHREAWRHFAKRHQCRSNMLAKHSTSEIHTPSTST